MPTGIGGEELWLSPTVANNVSPFDDQSGNGNNGTNNGSTVVSDSASGGSYAYSFGGTRYIRVPKANFAFLAETNSFSQSVWVKSNATGQRAFIGGNADNAGKGTTLSQEATGYLRAFRAKGGGAYSPNTTSSTAVPASQWTHFAWVVDNTTSTLYMNGVQVFQETGTFVTITGPLTNDVLLGCYESGTALYAFLDGLIDDVRIFDRAITQAEITHLATSRGVLGPPGGANHYNPFRSHAFTNNFQQRLR